MMKKWTAISHNNVVYELRIGSWFQHLHGKASEAIREVHTDDIILPNEKTVEIYKAEKRGEYNALARRPRSSAKQYLNDCSLRDFRLNWDKLIELLKKRINDACIPILLAQHALSDAESYELNKAASNGHISAMYRIGVALGSGRNDDCLLWLSMAHNRGHLGACYEMALHLAAKGNYIDSLRCLITSADGGFDIAYMSIFQITNLKNMFQIQAEPLESMLNELAEATHASSANYFKGMLRLFSNNPTAGIDILKNFLKEPKKKPSENNISEVYHNQVIIISSFIEGILDDIESGVPPLTSISNRGKQAGFCSFADYNKFFEIIQQRARAYDQA